jgi:hypothetical protein
MRLAKSGNPRLPLLARNGHRGMSDLSPLSGVERKSDLGAVRSAFDPTATFARLLDRRLLLILGILAVVGQQKSGGGRFTSPNRSSSSLLTIAKMAISFG